MRSSRITIGGGSDLGRSGVSLATAAPEHADNVISFQGVEVCNKMLEMLIGKKYT